MMTKAKALYQVKVILDYLSKEEYDLISKETLNYIENNYEYDSDFSIDPNIPLEKQNIDEKAYEILDKIIDDAEKTKNMNQKAQYIKEIKESNINYDTKIENIKLKNIIEALKKENSKIQKARDLLSEYKDALKQKDNEIEKLKKNNQDLYDCIQGLPKIIKKLFIKNLDIKILNS